ncbi:MAG: hypothetical protein MUC76_02250 [Spirochaetes bacterium]|nr:hypothetical protein [Spirochaetota bacterium]
MKPALFGYFTGSGTVPGSRPRLDIQPSLVYARSMNTQNLDRFREICTRIAEGTPHGHSWKWDDRFNAALMAFDAAVKERVFGTVINEFVQHWDATSIAEASQRVRGIVDSTFDIRPGQLIFAAEANGDFILLAAWWPWANGSIISMRIGLYSTGRTPIPRDDAARCLREWLDVKE